MPLASCIQVSMETKDPICGPYPGFGPMMLRFESLASAISGRKRAPPNRVENPAVRAADPLRKLLRLEKHSLLKLCRAMKSCLPAAMACLLQYLNNRLVIPLTGTGAADSLSSKFDLATKIDSFTALRADDPLTFIARKLFRRQLHVDWLGLEELVIGHFSIGQHLLLVLAFNFRVHAFGQGLGRFACGHAHGLACFHINKGSGNLAPVAKLESALAQTAAGNDHTASVAQRSISTKVTMRLRSLPWGSSKPSFFRPNMAMRTPRTCPAQRWPCATAASSRYSCRDFIVAGPLLLPFQAVDRHCAHAPQSWFSLRRR